MKNSSIDSVEFQEALERTIPVNEVGVKIGMGRLKRRFPGLTEDEWEEVEAILQKKAGSMVRQKVNRKRKKTEKAAVGVSEKPGKQPAREIFQAEEKPAQASTQKEPIPNIVAQAYEVTGYSNKEMAHKLQPLCGYTIGTLVDFLSHLRNGMCKSRRAKERIERALEELMG